MPETENIFSAWKKLVAAHTVSGLKVYDTRFVASAFVHGIEELLSVSAWMTVAAREALQRRAGLAAVARWEKEHGCFTTDEMDEARGRVRAQLLTPRTLRRRA